MSKTITKITIAASKSYLQRALAISALAKGTTILTNISWCDDSTAARHIIEQMGAEVSEKNKQLSIINTKIKFTESIFNADESGLSLRMFAPILALSKNKIKLTGEGSLKKRPLKLIIDALKQLDVDIESNINLLPISIKGPIKPSKIEIDGSLSSQLLTGLLIALPLADGDSIIEVENLKSTPYIDMTLDIMRKYGIEIEKNDYKTFRIKGNQKYKAINYNIEGDWSAGAFFLVYGAVKNGIEINNLNSRSLQADKKILNALELAGAKVSILKHSIKIERDKLNAFNFDATNCPDLFPPLACLASQCRGTSVITGISRLIHKESNRAKVLKAEFEKMGIQITLKNDEMYITGSEALACTINPHNDHRIAMAGGIMNLFCKNNIMINNKNVVNKSYPNFFKDINGLLTLPA